MIQNVAQDRMVRVNDLTGLTLEADEISNRVPEEKQRHSPRDFVSCETF